MALFFISFLDCPLSLCRKHWFLYPLTFSFISFNWFLRFTRIFQDTGSNHMQTNTVLCNISSSSTWIPFIYFPYLLMARTSSMLLNKKVLRIDILAFFLHLWKTPCSYAIKSEVCYRFFLRLFLPV